MSETKEAASAEPEVEDAVKERERAKAAKRAERQELRERNQEILIENTQVLFENLAKYLQGELKGERLTTSHSRCSNEWGLSITPTNECRH